VFSLRKPRAAWSWALFSLWMVGTAFAFWSFEIQHQRSFETVRTARFEGGARARSAESWFRKNFALASDNGPYTATVMHVYRADCPCNRFTHPHLARIIQQYQARGVNFRAALLTPGQQVAVSGAVIAGTNGPSNLAQVVLPDGNNELQWIEATPAALVFDSAGRLIYFGPYSDSGRCGESGGLVEKVLDRLLLGQSPRPQPFYGGGCFCGAS
jgi:hypothetical protein